VLIFNMRARSAIPQSETIKMLQYLLNLTFIVYKELTRP
jgi:hypothetical protein